MSNTKTRVLQPAFTIMELLIVIVIISILVTVTVVSYRGITSNARQASVKSALKSAYDEVNLYQADNGSCPSSLSEVNLSNDSNITYQYTCAHASFSITAMYNGLYPSCVNETGVVNDGPCDGHSGGNTWCPESSYVTVNGYYCEGTTGSTATLNNSVVKLLASDSSVPSGAPGAYVGRQRSRDNLIGSQFNVSTGDVYCLSEWAVTTSSTVSHAIGLQVLLSDGTRSWPSAGRLSPSTQNWTKASGCITIWSGVVKATVWTQNDGSNGTTASDPWYQTAIKLYKQ